MVLTAAYGLSPFDLISDAIIGIGWIEDLGIYLSLRRTVYSGYHRDEGVIATIRRELSTIFKLCIPIFMIALFCIIVYFVWII